MSAESNKGFIRYLFVFYPIPIRPNVKNDMAEGTKKARETSDMVGKRELSPDETDEPDEGASYAEK